MTLDQLQNIILEYKVFTEDECNRILTFKRDLVDTNYTIKLDGKFYEKGCSMKSQDLLCSEDTEWVFSKIKNLIETKLNVNCVANPHAVFRNYTEGDYFLEHRDNVDKTGADPRYFTVTVQLSDTDDYTGGDVIADRVYTINRHIGSAAIWGSNVIHEVKNISKGVRNSLIFFVSSKHIKLNKTNLI